MKVTVCFGPIRVVVPCGNGELLVRDLEREAIRRYKKASGKNPDSWVVVHHLQSQSGILDPDDRLNDVADDREQIIASYDDHPGPDPGVPQGGGDGASGSSVGTGSPDIFRNDTKYANSTSTHIEVTSEQPPTGLGLQVRRGSEPSLHQIGVTDQRSPLYNVSPNQQQDTKRWSAAPVCRSDSEPPERILSNGSYLSPEWNVPEEESQDSIPSTFSRSGRLSMQFLGNESAAGFRWMDAAEKIQTNYSSFNSKSLPRESKRKEPLGQANASVYESIRDKDGEMVLIMNENGGPLGLSALADSENGGLLVQNVEPGSRADRGRLRRGDRILEINGVKLMGLSEGSVQETLKKSITSSELRLRVIRSNKIKSRVSEMIEAEEKPQPTKVATVSPTRKVPGAPAAPALQVANTRKLGRRIEISLKKGIHGLGFSVTTRDNPAGGHCPIYIKNVLPKGAAVEDGRLKPGDRLLEVDGVPMTGKTQTEVVGILRATQPGATVTIVVSRQQELAEIEEREIGCGIDVEQYKNTPPKPPPPILPKSNLKSPAGGVVGGGIMPSKSEGDLLRNPLKPENINSNSNTFPWKNREILTLHIPVHDTEKAGLGVSVKGKTGSSNSSTGSANSSKHDGDLGIFVKSVLHGGAASRDGRLKMNDQLLSINGISLLGQSNAEAMDTLRRAMLHTSGGTHPGKIILTVARRIGRPMSTGDALEAAVENSNSNSSEQSGATVIYLSPNNKQEQDQHQQNKRWSNPVLDRLTGGTNIPVSNMNRPSPIQLQSLRNESYYMATNENWSPCVNMNGSNAVLIEEDPEPTSPTFHIRGNDGGSTSTPCDATYSSQLSLDTNPPQIDPFSRDAIGRRSMSEKHHAALDAKETGTYQRNKKIREEREREKRVNNSGSVESLTFKERGNSLKTNKNDLKAEAMDRVGELGPSLGMKKSSSLESLQTMVQEIQMSDEPRGPVSLRTPRGRGREESLRAAVERPPENQPRKHWLLEDGPNNSHGNPEGGFPSRNSPFQSSLNHGKQDKLRQKKSGLLKGIGHMFRFGKHRKDCIAPAIDTFNDSNGWSGTPNNSTESKLQTLKSLEKTVGPPQYQPPPPPVPHPIHQNGISAIQHGDVFQRYSHYVNYEELQHQISINLTSASSSSSFCNNNQTVVTNNNKNKTPSDALSESIIEQMRQQVMYQREKVEEESRRHQHYHSQRSTRNMPNDIQVIQHHIQHQKHKQRPISSFYEYETIQQNGGSQRKMSQPSSPSKQQNYPSSSTSSYQGSIRSRGGPFVTQVHIQNQIPYQ